MKFDKETAIVVLVCAVVLGAWFIYWPKYQMKHQPAPVEQEQSVPVPSAVMSPEPAKTPEPVKETVRKAVRKRAAVAENKFAAYYFNSEGVLDEIVMKTASRTGSEDKLAFAELPGFEPFTCLLPDGWILEKTDISDVSESRVSVVRVFRRKGDSPVTIRKDFTVAQDAPALSCEMTVTGSGPALESLIVWGGTMAPLKQFSNDDLRDVHQVEYLLAATGKLVTADPSAKKLEKFYRKQTSEPVRWVAVSNKYFLSQLRAATPFNGGCRFDNSRTEGYAMPAIGGVYRNVTFPAKYEFTLYSGEKSQEMMSKLPADSSEAIHLAYWGWLEPICRPMLALLNLLKGLTGSYGWAIILLTVLVKLVLWPLIHRGNKSMRRLQKIQPAIKELKEKYKDNQQLFNQKMWEIYREKKVNPVGGCFPMLLQFPVFVALYSTLESAVELRHVPFLWAADLSQPDVVGPLIFGFGIHPLILLSTGLMVLQMKIQPQAGDPTQQKIMMFMPLFMLIFFYSFPSGLALYWTVNNILSILQMKFSQYSARREDELAERARKKA